MSYRIVIFFVLIFCISCEIEKNEQKDVIDSQLISKNLSIAKQFVEEFLPDTTTENGFNKMCHFPDSIVSVFKAIRLDKQNCEKYLTLLFLKIYRGHLLCCHQSYDIRCNSDCIGIDKIRDPLLYEYNLITYRFNVFKRYEFISSGFVVDWVNKQNYLLNYEPIKLELSKIHTIEKNIENGVYWKN
jgi:hypothetical protein